MNRSINIGECMTEYPYFLNKDTSILDAEKRMTFLKIRHMPVIENQKIIGIVSQRDLRQALALNDDEWKVEHIMTRDPFIVRKGTPLKEVAKVMATKKYGSTLVADYSGQVVGIFTTTDGMELLSQLLSDDETKSKSTYNVEDLFTPWEKVV